MAAAATKISAAPSKLAGDIFAWCFNVTSAVLIILVNKVLMSSSGSFRFTFATTLCAFHYLTCAAAMWIAEHLGLSKPAKIPLKDLWMFVITSSISIGSLNLSLMLNSVGFYQIAKLLNVPFVCAVEAIFFNRPMTLPVVVAAAVVVSGVAIVSVTDVSVKLVGGIVALVSVVSSGMQQITCGELQRNHDLTPNQLLAVSAPLQGLTVLMVGPFIDRLLTKSWVFNYHFTLGANFLLALSCAIAILVNISQFMCLGRFSATSFQVMGHAKTVCVLIIGWAFFGDTFTYRKFIGMSMAVVGMMIYGFFASRTPKAAPKPDREEKESLLGSASK